MKKKVITSFSHWECLNVISIKENKTVLIIRIF